MCKKWISQKSFEDKIYRNNEIDDNNNDDNKQQGKYGNWSMGNQKLSSEIGQLEIQIAKFRNRNFEELDSND